MELALTQQEADKLILLLKTFLKDHSINLKDGDNLKLDIKSTSKKRKFKLFIHYEYSNYHLNFMDVSTKINLIRINLNNSFHKNADGQIIRGDRVNLFCEEEFNQRQDGQYMRAYSLPYKNIIKDPKTFPEALDEMLNYINIDRTQHKLKLEPTLF